MNFQKAIKELQSASFADRIKAIELLLQSVKNEITVDEEVGTSRKPFRIRTFDLGGDVQYDRNAMYLDRS